MAKADSPTKVCGEDGCGRPMRARGLCSAHYNQAHQPDRHRKVTVQCGWCGKDCEKEAARQKRYEVLFCSSLCRDSWREGHRSLPRPRWKTCASCGMKFYKAGVKHCPTCVDGRVWESPPRALRPRWVAGQCRECGEHFVAVWLASASSMFCSLRCTRKFHRRIRRARLRGVLRENYRPVDVYRRDGWRCHICRRLTKPEHQVPQPLAPTIDHLVPIARGGDDILSNVACAHFICNARKTDLAGAQLLLFGDAA